METHLQGFRDALNHPYKLNGQEYSFSAEAKEAFENTRLQSLKNCQKRYDESTQIVQTNDGLLRYWIANNILFTKKKSDEALTVWKALKESNLIRTLISDNLDEWDYKISTAVKEFFIYNPAPHTLTLGCGTTIFNKPENDDLTECGTNLPGTIFSCVTCGDYHKNELSIALPNSEGEEFLGYAPSSHATLRGSMFDDSFWEALGNYKFSTIKDHSAYHEDKVLNARFTRLAIASSTTDRDLIEFDRKTHQEYTTYAHHVAGALKEDGLFELLNSEGLTEDSPIVQLFKEAGLFLKKVDLPKRRAFFVKKL